MDWHIVGAYGGDSPQHRMTCFVINQITALDAGSLTRGLTVAEQRKIRNVVISHAHMDHICALPFLVENVFGAHSDALTIYCIKESTIMIKKGMFNNDTWPDFTKIPDRRVPSIQFTEVQPEVEFEVEGIRFTPVPVNHIVPTVGYLVKDRKSAVVYTSDTGPTDRIWEVANEQPDLKGVIVEVSFDSGLNNLARLSKHLTPSLLQEELKKLKRDVPVYLYHLKPPYIEKIKKDLARMKDDRVSLLVQDKTYTF